MASRRKQNRQETRTAAFEYRQVDWRDIANNGQPPVVSPIGARLALRFVTSVNHTPNSSIVYLWRSLRVCRAAAVFTAPVRRPQSSRKRPVGRRKEPRLLLSLQLIDSSVDNGQQIARTHR